MAEGGGQTEASPSGWTVDTSKVYLDDKIESTRQSGRERFLFLAVVIALGWNELQRRLVTLNHAHEQHESTLAATVSSVKYESDRKQEDARLSKVEQAVLAAGVAQQTSETTQARSEGAARAARDEAYTGRQSHKQSLALTISAVAIVVSIILAIGIYLATKHSAIVVPTPTTAPATVCLNVQKAEIPC
jgi:hypothetical protein